MVKDLSICEVETWILCVNSRFYVKSILSKMESYRLPFWILQMSWMLILENVGELFGLNISKKEEFMVSFIFKLAIYGVPSLPKLITLKIIVAEFFSKNEMELATLFLTWSRWVVVIQAAFPAYRNIQLPKSPLMKTIHFWPSPKTSSLLNGRACKFLSEARFFKWAFSRN